MHSNQNPKIEFVEALAKLFYAVAACDKTVRMEERKQLYDLIQNDWIPINENFSELKKEFDNLILVAPDYKTCFSVFKDYQKNNEDLFTSDVKIRIWKTVSLIADVVAHKNKSELVLLSQIYFLLELDKKKRKK